MKPSRKDETHERRQSLWRPMLPPIIFGAHFLLSYITGAIWCAKFAGPNGSLGGARAAIAIYTVLALAGIIIIGRGGWQRHVFDRSETTHDFDTPEDRHRFLGFATALLAGLSALATIFTALAIVFIKDCR